jgi:hypothetical protein
MSNKVTPVMATRAKYHGTHVEAHGEYRVVGPCVCATCDAWLYYQDQTGLPVPEGRVDLANGDLNLRHVRISSVTWLD